MNSMKLHFFLLVVCLLALLTSCGDSSNDQEANSSGTKIAGVVEDGPIENAIVLLCDKETDEVVNAYGPSGMERCEDKTKENGNFSFSVNSEVDLDDLVAVSIGGFDNGTGVDFTGMEMRAPLEMLGNCEDVTVNPVTTLVAGKIRAGLSLEKAQNLVRSWLGLGKKKELCGRPSEDLDLLKRSLLLTKMAMEKKKIEEADPFGNICDSMDAGNLLDAEGNLDFETLQEMGFDEEARKRIASLYAAIKDEDHGLSDAFKREEVAQAISGTLERMLQNDDTFDPDDPTYLQNATLLAQKILSAAADKVIPLGGLVPQRLARYVLFTYELTSFDAFTVDPATFENALVREENGEEIKLENDARIPELAGIKALHCVTVALLNDELLGDDNRKRVKYYYNSDISHLYNAEKLIGEVFDDEVNDAVMLKIVQGKAASGLLDEAKSIIETQIFQSEYKAHGYRYFAESLASFGKNDEAVIALNEAERLYKKVIDAKDANLANSDVTNLQDLAASYRKAGDLYAAEGVLDYLAYIASYLPTFRTYSCLIVGTWQVADKYIEEGDLAGAAPLVDSMYAFAQDTPANVVDGEPLYYKARIYNLVETAKRYADLGDKTKVVEIYNLIQSIRSDDGIQNLTEGETWVYIPNLIEVLYRINETIGAFSLADSIPDTYLNYKGDTKSGASYQAKSFKLVATYEALNYGLESALEIVDEHFTDDKDKIEALTYFASNKNVKYTAAALIEDGQIEPAKQALAEAAQLVDGLEETSDKNIYSYIVQKGYVKIADLYHDAGENALAANLLIKAETAVRQMAGAKYFVDGLLDTALGYYKLGNAVKTENLLNEAVLKADSAVAVLYPEDSADLYDAIIEAYLEVGNKDVATAIIANYVAVSRYIFDEGTTFSGNDHDDLAGKEIKNLIKAAEHSVSTANYLEAVLILDEAEETAAQIYIEEDKMNKFLDIVKGYANAKDFDTALSLAKSLPYKNDREEAIQSIAEVFCQMDDFPETSVASVDTDKDGKPNFFNPLATDEEIAESGLNLDDDSDGDGIGDAEDIRPLYVDA
jgi:hypothetical protein